MKKFDYDHNLAVLALGVVLFGVFAAADDALAGDLDGNPDRLAPRTQLADEEARQETMAEEALDALSDAIQLDLDIKLANPTSTASTTGQ